MKSLTHLAPLKSPNRVTPAPENQEHRADADLQECCCYADFCHYPNVRRKKSVFEDSDDRSPGLRECSSITSPG